MSRYIIELEGWLLEWSSIMDAPRTLGMRPDAFAAYYRDEYGREGARDLDARLRRVLKTGTSSILGETPEDVLGHYNRAGYRETFLTIPEIVRIYCVEQREPREGEGVALPVEEDS